MALKRVVIAGMGFGGLNAAKMLANSGLEVVMVDRNNYHLFQPLLYQVATAGLEKESIAYPLRALSRQWQHARFRMGTIEGVDLAGRMLKLKDGELVYDYLIMALGSRTSYFGNDCIEQHAFDLKQLEQAEALRNHILLVFEKASRESDLACRSALLTFVIVGGGPTGVEFAGALRELIVHVLSKDYPEIKPAETRIVMVEAASSLLNAMPEHLREYALRKVRSMGIEVMLEVKVVSADGRSVTLHNGVVIPTCTLFWSAGVAASEVSAGLGVPLASAGRVVVQPDLRLAEHPEVYVIGDMACAKQDGLPLPMTAPVAEQQGRHVAASIMAVERGETVKPFVYKDKGAMATIGRSAAVAVTCGMSFKGWPAWAVWLMLHLYYLIGFRNRLLVLMNWAYYYFFHEHQVRLITDADDKKAGGAERQMN